VEAILFIVIVAVLLGYGIFWAFMLYEIGTTSEEDFRAAGPEQGSLVRRRAGASVLRNAHVLLHGATEAEGGTRAPLVAGQSLHLLCPSHRAEREVSAKEAESTFGCTKWTKGDTIQTQNFKSGSRLFTDMSEGGQGESCRGKAPYP
jgi:hypothetical protein